MADEALRSVLAKFGIEVDDSGLEKAIKRTDDFTAKLVGLADKLAGGSVLDSLKEMIGELKEKAGDIRGTAAQLGISNAEFQKLQFVSGASSEALASSFRVLQKNIAGATGAAKDGASTLGDLESGLATALGSKEAAEAFKNLGVEVTDATGKAKQPIDVFTEVGKKIASIEDPSTRTAQALKVFGRNGTQLLPFLAKGPEEIDALAKRFDELGGGLSDKTLKGLKEVGKAEKQLNLVTLSLKSAIAEQLLPGLEEKTKALTDGLEWIQKTLKGTEAMRVAFIVLAAAIAWQGRESIIAGAKTAMAYAPLVLTIAALILLFDDLITFLKGGDSVIGRTLDKFFDPKDGPSVAKMIQKDFADLSKDLDKIPSIGEKIEEVFSTVGASVVRFFVDDLPEAWGFFWKDMNAKAGTGGTTLGDLLKGVFTNIGNSLVAWASKAGGDIIDNLVGGLSSKWDAIKKAVTEVAKKIKDTFTEFFDMHSPSPIMADLAETGPVGGIVVGLARGQKAIKDQALETYSPIAESFPSEAYAPRATPGGGSTTVYQTNTVRQDNHIEISAKGSGDRSLAEDIRDSVAVPLNDNRRAALAALETLGGD